MEDQQKDALAQALILMGFAILILFLNRTGNILLYISPKIVSISKLSAVLLAVIGTAKLIRVFHARPSRYEKTKHRQDYDCCEHEHNHGQCFQEHEDDHHHHAHVLVTGSIFSILVFVVPLVFGFFMQPRTLTSLALANNISSSNPMSFFTNMIPQSDRSGLVPMASSSSLNIKARKTSDSTSSPANAATKANTPAPLSYPNKREIKNVGAPTNSIISGKAEDTDLMELSFNLDANTDKTLNHYWRVTGFVYKDPHLAPNQFVITRLVMPCCIADLVPIGIISESQDAPNLKADTWIEMEGVITRRNLSVANDIKSVFHLDGEAPNHDIPYFEVSRFERIPAPHDPYLYP